MAAQVPSSSLNTPVSGELYVSLGVGKGARVLVHVPSLESVSINISDDPGDETVPTATQWIGPPQDIPKSESPSLPLPGSASGASVGLPRAILKSLDQPVSPYAISGRGVAAYRRASPYCSTRIRFRKLKSGWALLVLRGNSAWLTAPGGLTTVYAVHTIAGQKGDIFISFSGTYNMTNNPVPVKLSNGTIAVVQPLTTGPQCSWLITGGTGAYAGLQGSGTPLPTPRTRSHGSTTLSTAQCGGTRSPSRGTDYRAEVHAGRGSTALAGPPSFPARHRVR